MKSMEQKKSFIEFLRSLPYGSVYSADHWEMGDIFPPPPRPTLLEVVADISSALSSKRGEFKSRLPPEDSPRTVIEVMQKDLGDEFVVTYSLDGASYRIERLLKNCPRCGGRGYFREHTNGRILRLDAPIPVDACYASPMIECDHEPSPEFPAIASDHTQA